MRRFERGQSLLEATIALGLLLLAVAIVSAATLLVTGSERPSAARLVALDAAGNAATELLAATAYDPAMMTNVGVAAWNSGDVALSSRVQRAGGSRIVNVRYVNGDVTGDIAVTLRAATVSPDAIVDGGLVPPAP